ncbi:hypothetical protein [uncultured Eudoraea sp.]|uniref:hypothetical protein n=1 Tax=uncultured Eudoraea sp. TaxID=1035614 RepID=UPI002607DEC0|nr:hypothetical protein [uncultured Eudoraea sp.]
MKTVLKVERLSFKTIRELPNSWSEEDYKNLLELMDYSDTSQLAANEIKELSLMSLTDNEPEDAAKIVLEYTFGNRLSKGQIHNLSNEMLNEKLWEEYADLSLHEELFNVNQLLYEAFNGKFPHPEAIKFVVKITAKDKNAFTVFNGSTEAALIRLLVAGMPENTLIYRLFEEQVDGEEFKEAIDIIWQFKLEHSSDNEILMEVISSDYWFHDFKYVEDFVADTYADEVSNTTG